MYALKLLLWFMSELFVRFPRSVRLGLAYLCLALVVKFLHCRTVLIVIHFHQSILSAQVTLCRNTLCSSFYLIRQWAHEIVSANEQVWFSIFFFLERGNFIDFKRIHQGDTSTRNVPGLCRKCTQPKNSLNITRYTSDRQSYD